MINNDEKIQLISEFVGQIACVLDKSQVNYINATSAGVEISWRKREYTGVYYTGDYDAIGFVSWDDMFSDIPLYGTLMASEEKNRKNYLDTIRREAEWVDPKIREERERAEYQRLSAIYGNSQ